MRGRRLKCASMVCITAGKGGGCFEELHVLLNQLVYVCIGTIKSRMHARMHADCPGINIHESSRT